MKHSILYAAVWLTLAGTGFAQGIQTGAIRGVVKDSQNLPVPGVMVSAGSAALQGQRSTTTDGQGLYALPALPAGDYQLKFDLAGFAPASATVAVSLGLTVEKNQSIHPAGVSEAVQVVAEIPAPIATPIIGVNLKQNEIESLASSRTILGIATLSPAVSEAAPNSNALVINGAFSFDNAFMVNGVDINDNVFATPQDLFVEDAIAETQVLTSGVSAEFGRFSGGIINAITKSGGNVFSGSGRINFSNPSWVTATPFEVSRGSNQDAHPNSLQKAYETTLGGPIVKDRLWFFGAGRYQAVDTPVILQETGIAVPEEDKDKRGEIKFTGTVRANQTIQAGYLRDARRRTNNSGAQALIIDPHSEVDRETPNWYLFGNYRGVLESNLLLEAQYSERRYSVVNDGGSSPTSGSTVSPSDLALHSPFVGTCFCTFYNAPAFDVTDPEERNNRQVTASASGFWNLGGRHETKGGYEFFRSQHTGGNSQSPTEYAFAADFLTDTNGTPLLDGTGRPTPLFVPGSTVLAYFPAIKGAVLNNDSHSAYVQDRWTINSRWSADLGARFEHVKIVSTGDLVSIDASRIVPRLATAYDMTGEGTRIVHATYGQYSGRYNDVVMGKNSPVGNPPEIDLVYQGPEGSGYNFTPAFNLANYPFTAANTAYLADPTQNVKVDPNLKSPLTHEFTASYGESLFHGRGFAEVSYIARTTHDIIEDFQTAGSTTNVTLNGVSLGPVTNIVYRNSDLDHRDYQAMVFQSKVRVMDRFSIQGHYTLELENDGNYEGEGTNRPGVTSLIGNYPEAFNAARNYPDGRLQSFQRSRLRIWGIYDADLKRFGNLSVSGLLRVDSAQVYSLVTTQPLTPTQQAVLTAAGYTDAPGFQSVFFDTRGSQFFKGFGVFDASINYNVPLLRTLRPWIKIDVFNLFNNQKLIAWNTKITPNPASPADSLGLPTGFVPGPAFGTATGNTVTNFNSSQINTFPLAFNGAQPGGRTLLMAVGFRF